jgi:outer membrane receptor protein involved in Fe transport
MLTMGNCMPALKFWRYRCALVIAALLLVIPASAQNPVDPDEDTASAEMDEASDPTDLESDLEEPDAAELEEALRMDMMQQASDIEEILVTGEKQNTLQDAPTSSTSFNASDLQALRIEDIADLANYTPNLEINTAFAASNPTIFIRGIGLKDYNANAAGAVAVYQDGININAPAIQLGQLFDIEGIDVMRGPQGSVNGRNATAGAIMIRSAMPDGEFGVTTSLTYGNYNDIEVETAINIPLIEDVLNMRVSGTAQFRDGYTKNQCAGWEPDKFIDPNTGEPIFRRIDETTTRQLYEDLLPSGKYVNGELATVEVKLSKAPANRTQDAFVFLNYQLAQGPDANGDPGARTYASGLTPGTNDNPWVLAEDLFEADGVTYQKAIDEFGNVVDATAGTSIAKMSNKINFTQDEVDGICVVVPPGHIATLLGHENNKDDADQRVRDRWEIGNWQATREQPGLEDFADLKRWTNNVDNWAARMVLLFQPLDTMEWMINAHGTQNRGDSYHGQMLGANAKFEILGFDEKLQSGFSENAAANTAIKAGIGHLIREGTRTVRGITPNPSPLDGAGEGGGNPYSGFYSSDGIEYIDAWGINGWGKWDYEDISVTLLYDYEWYNRVVEDEGDANPGRIFPATWSDSAWQTSEELRVQGDGERYKWTAGFFFLHERLTANNYFPDTRQFEINQDFSQKLTSWAPYANAELDLVEEGLIPGIDDLTLSLGVRYNQEQKKFTLQSSAVGTTSLVENQEIPPETRVANWKEWIGDVKLSYTPFSNEYGTLITYLKYGHGYKGGHFNAGLTVAAGNNVSQEIDPVEPEFIDAIELGIRSRWFDDRVIINAAGFRYWYKDLQVFDISNEVGALPIQKLLNGDANVKGVELELVVKPIPGFLISAAGGYLDTAFHDFVVRKVIPVPRGQPTAYDFDYEGNRLVAAPKWNFSVITEYEIPLFGWGSLVPQWDFSWRSKAYLDPQMVDPISQDAYWLHNARLAYRTPDDRVELAFWISNLLDEEYKVDVFDITRETSTIYEVWGEPRTYGVTLSLTW